MLGSKRVGRKLANARVDRKLANARAKLFGSSPQNLGSQGLTVAGLRCRKMTWVPIYACSLS